MTADHRDPLNFKTKLYYLSKLARARGGVRRHWGFTGKFTAPGEPHLGPHHLPPSPRCAPHTPGEKKTEQPRNEDPATFRAFLVPDAFGRWQRSDRRQRSDWRIAVIGALR